MNPQGPRAAAALLALMACHKPPSVALQDPVVSQTKPITLDAAGDGEGDTGWWPRVAFDANGKPHIAFCDAHHGDVRYATLDANGWRVRSIFSHGAVGKYIGMDIDTRGRLGISFYDQDNLHLRYAWQSVPGGSFSEEAVAWGREAGMAGEMVFDGRGKPHLFYYLAAGKLIHAVKADGQWTKEVLAPALGVYSARISAVAHNDALYISYVDWKMRDAALYLGRLDDANGTFTTETVAGVDGPGWHSQVLFPDSTKDSAPLVVHSYNLIKQTVMSTRQSDGKWKVTQLLPHGSSFAARMHNGRLVLAYQDTTDPGSGSVIRLTQQSTAAWPVTTVDGDGPAGSYMAMGIDAHGRVLLAYYADALRSLKLYDAPLAPL